LPLTLRRRRWRRRESNPLLLGASEVLCHLSYIPRCGRMESNHHSARRPVYSRGSSPVAQRPRARGDRPGSNRRRGDHNPGCFRLHHGHHRAGTTGLEPAASRLTSECSARLSYAPRVRSILVPLSWGADPSAIIEPPRINAVEARERDDENEERKDDERRRVSSPPFAIVLLESSTTRPRLGLRANARVARAGFEPAISSS
jgi:hypothetical protein